MHEFEEGFAVDLGELIAECFFPARVEPTKRAVVGNDGEQIQACREELLKFRTLGLNPRFSQRFASCEHEGYESERKGSDGTEHR